MPNSVPSDDDTDIGLAEMIENLRRELQTSLEKGKNNAVAFEIDKVELELKVAVSPQEKRRGRRGLLGRQSRRRPRGWTRDHAHVQAHASAPGLGFRRAVEGAVEVERQRGAAEDPGDVRISTSSFVLVKASTSGDAGESFFVGTGYFVTANLVLTASHVVPEKNLTGLEVRTERDGQWRSAALQAVWRDAALDAVLLHINLPLDAAPQVSGWRTDFEDDAIWQSSAYPEAGKVSKEGKPTWKTVGLDGTLHARGGGGQGPRELELTVNAPPPAEEWAGISGAPVFVGERLAGLIKEVPKSFQGGRLAAVPASALFQNHGFRLALSPPWLEDLPQGIWVLAVLSESNKRGPVSATGGAGALAKDAKALESVLGVELQPEAVRVPYRCARVSGALVALRKSIVRSTGSDLRRHWLRARSDAGAWRARGGATRSNSDQYRGRADPDATFAAAVQHPGNQAHSPRQRLCADRCPASVDHDCSSHQEGLAGASFATELPFSDLPAFDAVRCPYPTADVDGHSAVTRMLVLCSFGKDNEPNWIHVANSLVAHYPAGQAARISMLHRRGSSAKRCMKVSVGLSLAWLPGLAGGRMCFSNWACASARRCRSGQRDRTDGGRSRHGVRRADSATAVDGIATTNSVPNCS